MIVSTKLTKHSHYPAGIPAGFFYARKSGIALRTARQTKGQDDDQLLISVKFDPQNALVLHVCQIFPTRYWHIFFLTNKS